MPADSQAITDLNADRVVAVDAKAAAEAKLAYHSAQVTSATAQVALYTDEIADIDAAITAITAL